MSNWWEHVRALEPARVRAVWTAIVGVLLALGVSVSADLNGAVEAIIVALFAVLPLVQGEATRAKVTPTVRVDAELAEAAADADSDGDLEFIDEDEEDDVEEIGSDGEPNTSGVPAQQWTHDDAGGEQR